MMTEIRRRALILTGLLPWALPVSAQPAGWVAQADALATARQTSLSWNAANRARACPGAAQMQWVQGGDVLRVSCPVPAPGWTLYLPGRGAPVSQAPPVIRRGDPVDVEVAGAGLIVTLRGVALDAARAGAPLRVRRGDRGAVMRVEAVAAGRARLPDLSRD